MISHSKRTIATTTTTGSLSVEFEPHNDSCTRALLTIVARGNAIITELYRLVELVPAPFANCGQPRRGQLHDDENGMINRLDSEKSFRLDDIVSDFSYFKNVESFESRIESNQILKRADEDFCDNYLDILTRFYLTFESIQRYANDLNKFIVDLEDEVYVGQSLERFSEDLENCQLLCEAYFILGYMLLTTDNSFDSALRERIIVAYYRYSAYKSSSSAFDDTCNLMRGTQFKSPHQWNSSNSERNNFRRPQGYPECLFARAGVDKSVVNSLIARLQSMDLYNQIAIAFPHPDHRSTALASQASILYVMLYFCPNILESQRSRMREITDKFFHDNWIISVYMGELVNLLEAWEPYRAARESLMQLHDSESVKMLTDQMNGKLNRTSGQIQEYLKEGWLNSDSILKSYAQILNDIREANVTLRWVLLHSQMFVSWQLKLSKSLHSIVLNSSVAELNELSKYLQNLAVIERKFLRFYEELYASKGQRMDENKRRACETLEELVSIYNDSRPMRWVKAGQHLSLANLLETYLSQLSSMNFDSVVIDENLAQQTKTSAVSSRDSIIKLVNQIECARETYSDGKSLQVVQLFGDTRESLLRLVRYLSLPENVPIVLQAVGDFAYAWRLMDVSGFTGSIQQIIKNDPLKMRGIEAIFLKLASAFDASLMRIQQVDSRADLISVSQYYSSKLVSYIRNVLHIMPATILNLVTSIIAIQTDKLLDAMPSKIPLDNLKDYALPEKRHKMLELTYKISHYAEGIMMMQDTRIGLIKINSKQLLEDGIRRELVRKMSDSIQDTLRFSEDCLNERQQIQTTNGGGGQIKVSMELAASEQLLAKLSRLASIMNGYKRSFEYIQDYLFIYGLRMWQEELSRIVKFNVEQATMSLMSEHNPTKNAYYGGIEFSDPFKRQGAPSVYQSAKAPIPTNYGRDALESSFVVRILGQLLKITNPRATIYDEQTSAWYEQGGQHAQVADLRLFELIATSLGPAGLNGLDQICCALLMLELRKLDVHLFNSTAPTSVPSSALLGAVQMIEKLRVSSMSDAECGNKLPASVSKVFSNAVSKLAPFSEQLVNHLLRIGQLQAIRLNVSCVLSTNCRRDARNLYSCLETLNSTLLATLRDFPAAADIASEKRKSCENLATPMGNRPPSPSPTSQEMDDCRPDSGRAISAETLESSQLVFELTNHLEWIGLSDGLSKIYTLALHDTPTSQWTTFRENLMAVGVLFVCLLEQSSQFQFSRSISGFVPKQSKGFLYETSANVDGQPLFYAIITLLNHYRARLPLQHNGSSNGSDTQDAASSTALGTDTCRRSSQSVPLARLLQLMSLYVRCHWDKQASTATGAAAMATANGSTGNARYNSPELTLELVNVILSINELLRLSRQPTSELLADAALPSYVVDTFQFTICQLSSGGGEH